MSSGRRVVRGEALAQERLAARGVDRDAAADPCLRASGRCARPRRRRRPRGPSACRGSSLWFGHGHRPALQPGAHLRVAEAAPRARRATGRGTTSSLSKTLEVDARRGEDHAVGDDQRPPPTAHAFRSSARRAASLQPPSVDRGEDHHHQRRDEQVAVDHRQPGEARRARTSPIPITNIASGHRRAAGRARSRARARGARVEAPAPCRGS